MSFIQNAAPMVQPLGIEDLSTRQVTAVADEIPQHLPLIYIYAKKGPTVPKLVVGNSRSITFGEESFDVRGAYCNHATILSNTINEAANAAFIQRVKPNDAKTASLRLSLDLLETNVPEYVRNTDGTIKLDANGKYVESGQTIAGYKAKWVVEQVVDLADGSTDFGLADRKPGNMFDAAITKTSTRYPILDFVPPYFGGDSNNYGLRLWAPTLKSSVVIDPTILDKEKVYPLRAACMYRPTPTSTPKFVSTQYGEQYVDVCLKEGVINSRVDKQVYIGDVLVQAYQDLNNPSQPDTYGPFGDMHVYNSNIEEVLGLLYAKEIAFKDAFSDFTGVAGEEYRFNFVGGVSSSGVPYHSFVINTTDADAVRLTENSTLYLQGGNDGTMNDAAFAELVKNEIADWGNPLSLYQDDAKWPASIFYDSGFPLDTKYGLIQFIAARKDTFLVLNTFTAGGAKLSPSEDHSLAVALRTRARMYPESEYFGTPVVRAMVIGRSGKLINSQFTKHLPLGIEVASKAAKYMGAGNGKWKSGKNFDHAPGSTVTMFNDISCTFTPASVRNKDWDAGLNWVQSSGLKSVFFPALKTVYDDDTSVLNSFFTAMACCELQKVGNRAWREFSGVSSLTNEQLIERVNQFVTDNTNGRFDDRFVIVPETYFTDADLERGYSWSLRIKIYAPNMKTVMTLSVQANRIDDLAA